MPPPRLFVYGAVDTAEALCKAAKLLGWTTYVADARRAFATQRALPQRRPPDRQVARGGDRRGRPRPPDRVRRPHPRRQVRPARAAGHPRHRGVLRRRARLAPQPGEAPRAAARGRRPRGRARPHRRPRRAGRRRRVAGGDRALDPRRDPRRARRSPRRPAQGGQAPHPRAGRRTRAGLMDPGIQKVLDGMNALEGPARPRGAGRAGARRPRAGDADPRRPRRGGRRGRGRRARRRPRPDLHAARAQGRHGRLLPRRRLGGRLDRLVRHRLPRARQRERRDGGERRLPARARAPVPGRAGGLRRRRARPARRDPLAVAGDSAGGNLAIARRAPAARQASPAWR